MSKYEMPAAVQAVGLACVSVADMPPSERVLARQPVAAAVITLQTRGDGHREIVAQRLSDARAAEFPLTWLVDQALVDHAPVIITAADRALLATEAAKRRFFAEPRLAALCGSLETLDPLTFMGVPVGDEAALCRRLGITFPQVNDADVERGWNTHVPNAAEEVALGIAAARLTLWAHAEAFRAAEPAAFFETLLPLRDWMETQGRAAPSLYRAVRSRPIARATSFATTYRDYREARDAGDPQATWVSFEDALFHT